MSEQASRTKTTPLGRLEMGLGLWVALTTLTVAWAYPTWRQQIAIRCPLLELLGIPCPACGGTRAMGAFATGHWLEALAWNPLVAVGGMALVAFVPYALIVLAGWLRTPALLVTLPWQAKWVVGLLIGFNWLYLLLVLPR